MKPFGKYIPKDRVTGTMTRSIYIFLLLICPIESALAQTVVVDSLDHQGFQRKYSIHVPSNFSPTSPVPVVLMLHGAGGTMQNAQSFTNLNSVSELNGFLAVYPQGHAPVLTGFSWADGRGTTADQSEIDDIGFIDKLLDVLIDHYSADTNRLYIGGFSNGGHMTQRLACEANERFAAMASLGCTMDAVLRSNCIPERPVPMFLLSGTADTFAPYAGGTGTIAGTGMAATTVAMDTLVEFWVLNNNCNPEIAPVNLPNTNTNDNSTVTVVEFTECDCDATVKLYRINGGGHTWPGVSSPLYELIAGPTNLDIEASVELWNFFNQFTLCEFTTGLDGKEISKFIQIFPNPTSGKVFVNAERNAVVHYRLSNLKGQTVQSGVYGTEIDLTELSRGVYLLTLIQEHRIVNRKIIKQ